MPDYAESERKPVWLRMWESLHGPVTVTTPEAWAEADAKLEELEATLAAVDAEFDALRNRRGDNPGRRFDD